MKPSNKAYELYSIPTWFLKECLHELLPLLADIINASIIKGVVPSFFKETHVKPILKKPGFDPEVFKNFRPMCNLSFISKSLDKVVDVRFEPGADPG
ncbi:hypothetical protein HOLleu_37972 [Holothuria leucospilota]|uniref:Uncharacterized protein n=1 Tax=Holothuria leucospilota TaxID=206669 RepID=A0A9Q0YMJ9_HOLLE|nr:hypothetical protein HOLleu_37972 [Holothuria leucospilota]